MSSPEAELETWSRVLLLLQLFPSLVEPGAGGADGLHQLEGGIDQLLAVLVAPLDLTLPTQRAALAQPTLVGDGLGLVDVAPSKEGGVRDGAEPTECQLLPQLSIGRYPFLDFPKSATSLACCASRAVKNSAVSSASFQSVETWKSS